MAANRDVEQVSSHDESVVRAHATLMRWSQRITGELPGGTRVFDAHTHLGRDEDGLHGDYAELLEECDAHHVERAFVFALNEVGRDPEFRRPNDAILDAAARSKGRLIPFARLDLAHRPLKEAQRCLAAGAAGIKLHPRAQRFSLDRDELGAIFALAEERSVPILLHGGRGLPPIAQDLAVLVDRFPGAKLIIAHAGIADMPALAQAMAGKPQVYFDTSVWSALDLLACLSEVPVGQVLYASDYPYGRQPGALLMALRTVRAAGASEDQVRRILSGNAWAIKDAGPSRDVGETLEVGAICQPLSHARVAQYLAMSVTLYWTDQSDRVGAFNLASAATQLGNAADATLVEIRELVEQAAQLWKTALARTGADRYERDRLTSRLLHLAAAIAVTSGMASASARNPRNRPKDTSSHRNDITQ